DSGGTVHSGGTQINLISDLNLQQQQSTFTGGLVIKPGRKHRIIVDGTPFSASGLNTIQRTITYHGQTYNVNETVKSAVDLNDLFVGYQYDVISRPAGHLGFQVGGAYLDGTGTLNSVQLATTSTASQTIGLPLAGTEMRVFPLPNHHWIDFDGGVRGMAFGSYGHYFEGWVSGGVWFFNHIALQAGYRAIDADLHQSSSNGSGVDIQLNGPVFSMTFKW
ncbi:MAG: hypothetical protein JO061_20215, partial [Acidobacteriaceae bacterium]|nr:hypothetical protein [Acidobacteriaceae bacterium]